MTVNRSLLVRYLRQLQEQGERELFLDGATAEELVAALTSPPAPAPPASVPAESGGGVEGGPGARGSASTAGTSEAGARRELEVLRTEAAGCTRCRLHEGRNAVVFGEGGANAKVVVVGEAPGREEDKTGRPFVGPAGKLLDLMLLSVGLPREDVFICNVLKCRPPKNRDPRPDEVEACSPYLHRQLEIIGPRVLLTVGKFAAQTLLESTESIGRLRGTVHTYRGIPLVASYHPAYLLRSPHRVRATWEDFQLLRRVIDEHG